MIDGPLLVIVLLLGVILYHGGVKSSLWWRDQLHRLILDPWLRVYANYCGCKFSLVELKLHLHGPLMLYCDNKATIDIANNLVQHDRTKHIEIDHHFIKEKFDKGIVCLPYVTSASQVADILTKGLPERVFSVFGSKMGLFDVFAPS
jgi:hypothetical protein